jgi:hypothetical protein
LLSLVGTQRRRSLKRNVHSYMFGVTSWCSDQTSDSTFARPNFVNPCHGGSVVPHFRAKSDRAFSRTMTWHYEPAMNHSLLHDGIAYFREKGLV